MMPRPNSDIENASFAQSYGRNRSQAPFPSGGQGFGTGETELRQRLAASGQQAQLSAAANMQAMQMDQPTAAMMQNQAATMGFRPDMARTSPSMAAMAASATYNMGNMDMSMSPSAMAQRMQQQMNTNNIYTSMAAASSTGQPPLSPALPGAMTDVSEGRAAMASAAAGQGSSISQAEREEELLLNLLIARRQRGRMSDAKGGRNPPLAEELLRMRQGRQLPGGAGAGAPGGPQQRTPSLPPVPGMPPLFSDTMAGGPAFPSGILPPQRSDAMNLAALQHAEGHERIDRSPGRFAMDARSQQEMLDLSGRGFQRGGMFDANLKYAMGLHDLEMPPVKKKRKHKKKPADMPRRPLSAYNLFFSEERERILKEIDEKEGGEGAKQEEEGGEKEKEDESKPKALTRPLIPSQKKRRPHRKTHGKVSFQELARMVGERWKNLPEDRRKYYQDLAKEDMKRQKLAMEEYYAKQNAAKADSEAKAEEETDPKPTQTAEA